MSNSLFQPYSPHAVFAREREERERVEEVVVVAARAGADRRVPQQAHPADRIIERVRLLRVHRGERALGGGGDEADRVQHGLVHRRAVDRVDAGAVVFEEETLQTRIRIAQLGHDAVPQAVQPDVAGGAVGVGIEVPVVALVDMRRAIIV